MKTLFVLLAQYDGRAVVPIEEVARDYFTHLTTTKLLHKIAAGDIPLPLLRIESSLKAAKGVHVSDLAAYIDAQAADAREECKALCG